MTHRTKWQRRIDRGLMAAAIVLTWFVLQGVGNLDQDDQLINRGQQVTSCIGDRQDAVDQWRAVATFEFTHQVDRLDRGMPVQTERAEQAEQAIYALVDEKQEIRRTQLALIAEDDPGAEFTCQPIADELTPPPIP